MGSSFWTKKTIKTPPTKHREVFKLINFRFLLELAWYTQVIESLTKINNMTFIVISNIFVAVLNLLQESYHFYQINFGILKIISPSK